jgi:hypothetical protein
LGLVTDLRQRDHACGNEQGFQYKGFKPLI